MPRQGRIQSGTGVYHVMMRGINRQRIFEDSEDHYTFLPCLRSAQEQYTPLGDRMHNSCHYYAYALMSKHFHILLHAKDDTAGNIVKRIASSYVFYEFTSWHGYLARADFFPLCNVNVVLGRISIDELTALVDAPLDNNVSCIEYEEERDIILAALLRRHAGVRQLQRLTGIGKNIISNVLKTIC